MADTINLLDWNLGHQDRWNLIQAEHVDVALLQEATPSSALSSVDVVAGDDEVWSTAGWEKRLWRTAIARISDRVTLRGHPMGAVGESDRELLPVGRSGSLTVADVMIDGEPAFVAASMYAVWERPLKYDKPLWADASAHRLLSDLSPLLLSSKSPAMVVAGDLNLLHGYGEDGNLYWGRRYATVFDRADALGLHFIGPQHPDGRQAEPWPDELPAESRNVPTFHSNQQTPASATRQLDFVFVTDPLMGRTRVRALNGVDEWGPSDHCRVLIEIET